MAEDRQSVATRGTAGEDDPAGASTASLDAAWGEVEARWGEDAAHRRFLALARSLGELPSAGRRYREVRDTDPRRRAEAERRLTQVMAQALAHLDEARSARKPAQRRGLLWLTCGSIGVFLVYALLSILRAAAR
jgi:hypothetical protein